METRLNKNEVETVARMQFLIDNYELFIKSLFMEILSNNKEINVPKITGTWYDTEMDRIWRWVKEHKDNK